MSEERRLVYLSRADVEACGVSVKEILEALERAFAEKGRGEVQMPPKPGIYPRDDAFIHAMPCYIPGLKAAGLKWVAGFPSNQSRGLPYISGLVILSNPETGLPQAVMDCTWITAWRTAAVSALSARYLARPGAEVLAICGAGVQGRANLDALTLVLKDLAAVRVYDLAPAVLEAYVADMSARHSGLKIEPVSGPEAAVRGADVVLTAGPILKNPKPAVVGEWLSPGSLGLPLDFDSYFAPAAFLSCDKFLTDDVAQLRYYQTVGYFPELPPIHGDLGQLVAGLVPGRQDSKERIICCNLGLALDDVAAAALVLARAKDKGLGVWLDL